MNEFDILDHIKDPKARAHSISKREIAIIKSKTISICGDILELISGRAGFVEQCASIESLKNCVSHYYNGDGCELIREDSVHPVTGSDKADSCRSSNSTILSQPIMDEDRMTLFNLILNISIYLGSLEKRTVDIEDAHIESVIKTLDLMEKKSIPRTFYYHGSTDRGKIRDLLLSIFTSPDKPLEAKQLLEEVSKAGSDITKKPVLCPCCNASVNIVRTKGGDDGQTDLFKLTYHGLLEEEDKQILNAIKLSSNFPSAVTSDTFGSFTRFDTHPKPTERSIPGLNVLEAQKAVDYLTGKNKKTKEEIQQRKEANSGLFVLYPPETLRPEELFHATTILLQKDNGC